mmetsp:Transcript_1707/g.2686  ORF Transcript_1707/g.2686 Transcript_1707/m.2686 type:complete len:259 (-) Transcript_1707:400-1176(-)
MGKKRKFEPSADLERLLLELAGIVVQPSAEDLRSDAINLKRLANSKEGALKYLFYLRSSLRYFEYVETLKSPSDLAATLTGTAELLEYTARKSALEVRDVDSSQPDDVARVKEFMHLAVLGFRLAAIARLQNFVVKSTKLRQCWDVCKRVEKKRKKAEQLRDVNATNGLRPSGMLLTDEDTRQFSEYSKFVLEQSEDSLMAIENWQSATDLCANAKKLRGTEHVSTLEKLAPLTLMADKQTLSSVALVARTALDTIYG